MSRCFIGVSGWRYPHWRGVFYPTELREADELAYLAQRMRSVEINGSFYSLQRPSSYAAWAAVAPDHFVFAVKGSRYITHLKQLRDVETPLANFFASGVLALGAKLGPVLWQLPARMPLRAQRLEQFFTLLPRTHSDAAQLAARHDNKITGDRVLTEPLVEQPIRYALEPRHPSFATPDARALLAEHDVCMVVADSAGVWPTMHDGTSNFRYVRLHGETELYGSGYTDESLDRWASQCQQWVEEGYDTYVYFDNDAEGHAPFDALCLADRLAG